MMTNQQWRLSKKTSASERPSTSLPVQRVRDQLITSASSNCRTMNTHRGALVKDLIQYDGNVLQDESLLLQQVSICGLKIF